MTWHIRKKCRVPTCNECQRFGYIRDDCVRTCATIANKGAVEEECEITDEMEAEESAGSSLAIAEKVTLPTPEDKVPMPSNSCGEPATVPEKCDVVLEESTLEKV